MNTRDLIRYSFFVLFSSTYSFCGSTQQPESISTLLRNITRYELELNELAHHVDPLCQDKYPVTKILDTTTTLPTNSTVLPHIVHRIKDGTGYNPHQAPTELLFTILTAHGIPEQFGHLNRPQLLDTINKLYRELFHAFIATQQHEAATPARIAIVHNAFDELYYHPQAEFLRPHLTNMTSALFSLHKSNLNSHEKSLALRNLLKKYANLLGRTYTIHAPLNAQMPVQALITLQHELLLVASHFPTRELKFKVTHVALPLLALTLAFYHRATLTKLASSFKRGAHDALLCSKALRHNKIVTPQDLSSNLSAGSKETLARWANPVSAAYYYSSLWGRQARRWFEKRAAAKTANALVANKPRFAAGYKLFSPPDYEQSVRQKNLLDELAKRIWQAIIAKRKREMPQDFDETTQSSEVEISADTLEQLQKITKHQELPSSSEPAWKAVKEAHSQLLVAQKKRAAVKGSRP